MASCTTTSPPSTRSSPPVRAQAGLLGLPLRVRLAHEPRQLVDERDFLERVHPEQDDRPVAEERGLLALPGGDEQGGFVARRWVSSRPLRSIRSPSRNARTDKTLPGVSRLATVADYNEAEAPVRRP